MSESAYPSPLVTTAAGTPLEKAVVESEMALATCVSLLMGRLKVGAANATAELAKRVSAKTRSASPI